MEDPYRVLGVARTATADEIRQAYRRLAKKLHPDVNPADKSSGNRFSEVTAAYDLLSDEAKRARFDRGEIDASGAERVRAGWRTHGGAQAGPRAGRAGPEFGGGGFNPEDLFAELFGRGRRRNRAPKGEDIRVALKVPFVDAITGEKLPLVLPDGRVVNVSVPPGTEHGQTLRLRGQGGAGPEGALGDVYVAIEVEPHPRFRREGATVLVDLPISLAEAVEGATVEVPTVDGPVDLKVPPGANTGTRLRLKGRGAPIRAGGGRGDQIVVLQVVLPDPPDPELAEFLAGWAKRHRGPPPRRFG